MPIPRRFNISRRAYIFFNCLVLSAILWLLTTMSRVHTDKVSIPITYTNIPDNVLITNNLPDHITVLIQARGFKLLANRLTRTWSSLEINVDHGRDLKKGEQNFFVLPLRGKLDEITYQLGTDIKIMSIEPDSIYFQFNTKATKKVPVVMSGELEFAKQFGQSDPVRILPDSITISGSPGDLGKVDSVTTEYLTAGPLRSSYRIRVNIRSIPGITFSKSQVEVDVPVEALTEKVLEVPVMTTGIPDSAQMQIIPEKVNVKLLVPVSHFVKVVPESVGLEVTYPSPSQSKIRKVIVSVVRKPAFTKIISIDPPSVEYIIMVKR